MNDTTGKVDHGELSGRDAELLEYAATEARLAMHAAGAPVPAAVYVPREEELDFCAELAQRAQRREAFLENEIVSDQAAIRGGWQRQRGSSRQHRPQQPRRRSRLVASRDGPSDELPPLTRLRGFAAASARMICHLERPRAAIRIARMA
jgi:hypothetical protein